MKRLPPRLLLVPAFVVAATVHSTIEAADRTLLSRVHPTDVSWGEISFTEGAPVEVRGRKDPVRYPFTLKIACNQRGRREHPGKPSGRPAVAPARPRGAVYFAARLDRGREAWKDLVEKVVERSAALTPESFGTFVRQFPSVLIGRDPVTVEGFRGVTCLSVEGESDQAWEVERVIEENGVRTGSTGFKDARAVCGTLAGALDHEPPTEMLATRFEVRAQREETLVLQALRISGSQPVAWPEGAGIEYGEPPEGATAYTSRGATGDGTSMYEELRPPRSGGPPETRKPYLLKSRARDAAIATEVLDANSLLVRWIWRVRDVVLGTEPATTGEEKEVLDVALLFAGPHEPVNEDRYARRVAREFAASDETPGLDLLERLARHNVHELGPDAVLGAFCDPARADTATYCIAEACAKLLNPRDFCGVLATRLDSQLSAR